MLQPDLLQKIQSLASETAASPDRDTRAVSVVLQTLLGAIMAGEAMALAGTAAAYSQLAIPRLERRMG